MNTITKQNQISTFISPATYRSGVVIPQLKPAAEHLENVYVIFVENNDKSRYQRQPIRQAGKKNKKDERNKVWKVFKSLRGSLKGVKEFKGMNGVDLQHYIYKNLW